MLKLNFIAFHLYRLKATVRSGFAAFILSAQNSQDEKSLQLFHYFALISPDSMLVLLITIGVGAVLEMEKESDFGVADALLN